MWRVGVLLLIGTHLVNCSNIMKISALRKESGQSQSLMERGKTNEDSTSNSSFLLPELEAIEVAIDGIKNRQCRIDSQLVLASAKRKETWAMQMLDASTKLPTGVLYGAYYNLGNFDECVDAKQPAEHAPFRGKYCLADVNIKRPPVDRFTKSPEEVKATRRGGFNDTIHWAICVPSTCSNRDARDFLNAVFKTVVSRDDIEVDLPELRCHDENTQVPLSNLEIVYGVLLGIFLMLVVLATLFHFIYIQRKKKAIPYTIEGARRKQPSTVHEVILMFSVIQNVQKIFHIQPNELNLECVSGIKVLSMIFILGSHALMFLVSGPVLNTEFFERATMEVQHGFLLNNPLMVDTFLLLGAFLMCRLLLIELDKRKGRINFLFLYLARYLRLTPSYAMVLGLYCTYLARVGNGPLWDQRMALEKERCLRSWWSNLLYINNYFSTDYLCMFQSWYLAVDTQLFILAPIIIYPLWRWRKIGETLLGCATAITLLVPFIYTFVNKLDPTLMIYASEVEDISKNHYFINAYVKTHMRANAYCIGLILGYVVHRIQSEGKKMPSKVLPIGWIFAAVCGVISMFSIVVFYMPGHEYDRFESSIYSAFHRMGWCLAIAWVILACVTDSSALVNKCLTWKIYIPLARLTYCAYLVNGIIELYSYGVLRAPIYMSIYNLLSIVISHVVLTFALAFIVCVLFESPIHGLERILLKRDLRRHTKSSRE